MSEEIKGSNGAPIESANGVDAENANLNATDELQSKKDTVAYETYKKALGLAKKREQELEVLRAEKQQMLEEKMASEGKKDELLETYKKKNSEYESKFKKVVDSFASKSLASSLNDFAKSEGCFEPNDLIALGDISGIEVDEDFNVNMDQVKEFVLNMKKSKPHLFSGFKPVPKTGVAPKADDLKPAPVKKSIDELALELAMLNNKR